MVAYSRSRVKLILQPNFEEDVIVSRERTASFKNWLLKIEKDSM